MRMFVVALLLATTNGCASASDVCARDCAGCCDADGKCHHGDEATACGPVGKLCVACGVEESCSLFGTCYNPCGPKNCAGCCTVDKTCRAGVSADECGIDGASCGSCAATETCRSGRCQP